MSGCFQDGSYPDSAADLEDEGPRALTVLQLAEYKLGRPAVTGADFEAAGLAMLGGCEDCHATVAAYNAYPSRSGYWRCAACIGDGGWTDLAEMATAIYGPAVCPACHRPLEADR
jgi:crotonobetainyl-CoA:carnitine CoA-transferase CaiB-like acyl-CoA transferase